LMREIERVEKGLDPKGVVRDSDTMIDTKLMESLRGPEGRPEYRISEARA